MLIECNHCGAPLDVKANARSAKCKYCDTTSRVAQVKQVAAETPQGWQPPRQWTPPAHVPADSAQTLVYHAGKAARRVVSTIIALSLLGVIAPLVVSFLIREAQNENTKSKLSEALGAAKTAIEGAQQQVAQSKKKVGIAEAGLIASGPAVRLVEAYQEALAHKKIRALRMTIHDSHSSLQAQDPNKPENVDEYRFRGGSVTGPDPVRLIRQKGKLDEYLFDLRDVAVDYLDDMKATTLEKLAYEDATVTHVIIERGLPFHSDVVIRVYASGPRDSGRIDFTGTGKIKKVYR